MNCLPWEHQDSSHHSLYVYSYQTPPEAWNLNPQTLIITHHFFPSLHLPAPFLTSPALWPPSSAFLLTPTITFSLYLRPGLALWTLCPPWQPLWVMAISFPRRSRNGRIWLLASVPCRLCSASPPKTPQQSSRSSCVPARGDQILRLVITMILSCQSSPTPKPPPSFLDFSPCLPVTLSNGVLVFMVISISIQVNSEVLYLGLWIFWSPLLRWHGPQLSTSYQLPFSRTDPSVISVTPIFYSPSPLPLSPWSLPPGSQYQQFLAPNKASTDPTLILLSFIILTSVLSVLCSLDSVVYHHIYSLTWTVYSLAPFSFCCTHQANSCGLISLSS